MEECPICYEDMPAPTQLRCGHTFHKHCIDKWAETHCTCPYCRFIFYEKPKPDHTLEMTLAMLRILIYTCFFLFLVLFKD